MAPLTVGLPATEGTGSETPAYNVRLSRSGKPYIVWSKSAAGTPASSAHSSRPETPATLPAGNRQFRVTTNASIGWLPPATQRGEPAGVGRTGKMVYQRENLASASRGSTPRGDRNAAEAPRRSSITSGLQTGVVANEGASAAWGGSSQLVEQSMRLSDHVIVQHAGPCKDNIAAADTFNESKRVEPLTLASRWEPPKAGKSNTQDINTRVEDGSTTNGRLDAQDYQRDLSRTVSSEQGNEARMALGMEQTDNAMQERQEGSEEQSGDLVCDVCINKHMIESKHEQQRREREERQRAAAEASFRAAKAQAEWEWRTAEERAKAIEREQAERAQYLMQKEQARQEYVASPRGEPAGPAGMLFKDRTSKGDAEEGHARYKEELDQQVALKNRLALEEAAKDHPLGTYPMPLRTSQWEQESFAEAKKESYSDALAKQLLEKEAIRAAERTAPHPLGKTNMVVVSKTPTRQAELGMQAALRESLAKQVKEKESLEQQDVQKAHPLGEVHVDRTFMQVDYDKVKADHQLALRAELDKQVSERKLLKEMEKSAPHPLGGSLATGRAEQSGEERDTLQQKAAYRKLLDEQVAQREAWRRLTETGAHPLGDEPVWGRIDNQQALREHETAILERTKSYQEVLTAQIAEKEREKQARFMQEQAAREEQLARDRAEAQRAKQEEIAKTYSQKMMIREAWLKDLEAKEEKKRQDRLAKTALATQTRNLAAERANASGELYETARRDHVNKLKSALESQIMEKKNQKRLEKQEFRSHFQEWCGDESNPSTGTLRSLAKGVTNGLAGGKSGYLGNYLKCVECKRTVPAKMLAPWKAPRAAKVS